MTHIFIYHLEKDISFPRRELNKGEILMMVQTNIDKMLAFLRSSQGEAAIEIRPG